MKNRKNKLAQCAAVSQDYLYIAQTDLTRFEYHQIGESYKQVLEMILQAEVIDLDKKDDLGYY